MATTYQMKAKGLLLLTRFAGEMGVFRVEIHSAPSGAVLDIDEAKAFRDKLDELIGAYYGD